MVESSARFLNCAFWKMNELIFSRSITISLSIIRLKTNLRNYMFYSHSIWHIWSGPHNSRKYPRLWARVSDSICNSSLNPQKESPSSATLTLIRESWKKIQNAGKPRAQRCIICICSCALDFFPGKRAWWDILAYAIWNWHHKIAQLTLYLHI